MKSVSINLCCNDHRNGMFQGWVEDVSINHWIEFNGPRVRCGELPMLKMFRLGRVRFPVITSRQWVGNWCWDAIQVSRESALKAINYLKFRGWSIQVGPSRFFRRWEKPGLVTIEELTEALRDDE